MGSCVGPPGGLSLVWTKDGSALGRSAPNLQLGLDATWLHLGEVEEEDEGSYACVANNPAGTDSREFRLIVIRKTLHRYNAQRLTRPLRNVTDG